MLGTSHAWLTSHLSQRMSKPAYYIVDCRILKLFNHEFHIMRSYLIFESTKYWRRKKNQIKHFLAEPQRQGFDSLKYLQVNPMEKSKVKTSSDSMEFVSEFDKVQVF